MVAYCSCHRHLHSNGVHLRLLIKAVAVFTCFQKPFSQIGALEVGIRVRNATSHTYFARVDVPQLSQGWHNICAIYVVWRFRCGISCLWLCRTVDIPQRRYYFEHSDVGRVELSKADCSMFSQQ